jgi:hypothetical protein
MKGNIIGVVGFLLMLGGLIFLFSSVIILEGQMNKNEDKMTTHDVYSPYEKPTLVYICMHAGATTIITQDREEAMSLRRKYKFVIYTTTLTKLDE